MTRVATVVLVIALATGPIHVGHDVLIAQQRLAAGPPIWNGSVRGEIDLQGPGYMDHQTHSWTLTGAPPADGGVLDYPGTWTVSGDGSRNPTETQRSTGTWTTQGSAPGVRMAITPPPTDPTPTRSRDTELDTAGIIAVGHVHLSERGNLHGEGTGRHRADEQHHHHDSGLQR